MAEILVDGDHITVSLSALEKVEALRGDVSVPRTSLVGARVVANGLHEVRGVRAPGTGFPSVIKVGTWRHSGLVTFAACHGRGPAVVLDLTGARYDRIVVTVHDPEATLASLG